MNENNTDNYPGNDQDLRFNESEKNGAPEAMNEIHTDPVEHAAESSASAGVQAQSDYEYHYSHSQINQSANADTQQAPPVIPNQTYTGNTGYTGYTQPSYSNSYTKDTYAAATGSNTYTHMFSDGNTKKPKRPKKQKSRLGAGGIILCILLSMIFGFGGAAAAMYLLPRTSAAPLGSGVIINTVGSSASEITTTTTLNDVVTKTLPSVVEVTTEMVVNGGFFGQYVTQGAGSGVIISEDGYIVTNNHVVEGGNNITVKVSGENYAAELIGTDAQTDIAVLKIECSGLSPATFGNSDAVKVGDSVIAIGNPLGTLGGSVTDGIISALEREVTIDGQKMTLLQTNAQVNPGNSGGGLFNMNGELIGIVNSKSGNDSLEEVSIEGIGFAIPADRVQTVATSLIENGYVSGRVALGVQVLSIETIQNAQQYGLTRTGVYVVSVDEGFGAEKAGMQAEDYILTVDGNLVETVDDISAVLAEHSVGDVIEVQVVRDGRIEILNVELMERH